MITRHRVVELLDDAVRRHPLTLVVGGAGTGKTLAVAAWTTEGRPPGPVAWLSLDRGLRTPERFWKALREAVQFVLGADVTLGVAIPQQVDDEFVGVFAAAVGERELVLILDDVQELAGSDVWDGWDLFLRRLPPRLRVVLVARHDPPIGLHRLRVAGSLAVVRAADLAFTAAEALSLLADHGVRLPPEAFDQLMGVTEGWAAGLRLALITLKAADSPAEAARRFSGRVEVVAGYIMDEVIRNLDPPSAELLRRTSICDRMSVPLAEALADDPDAPGLLDLSRRNAFVVELDDSGWYRYHPLMLQVLRAQLHARSPELEPELHRRAALWFEGNGEWMLALEHAIVTQDWDLVALVTLRSAAVRIFSAERAELACLIDAVPPHVTHDRADLQLVRAVGAFCRDDHEAESTLLADVAVGLSRLRDPVRALATLNLLVLQAAAARRAGDAIAMTTAAREAQAVEVGLTVDVAPGWTSMRGTTTALMAIGELWTGNPRRFQELMHEAMARSRTADIDDYGGVYYQGHYAISEHALGHIASARDLALAALQIARQTGSDVRHEARAAHLALAAAELQRADAEAAAAALNAGEVAAARGDDPFVKARLRVVAGRRCLLLGDLPGARRHLAELPPFLVTYPRMALVTSQHAALQVEIELASGAVDRAVAAVARYDAASERADAAPRPREPDPLAVARARVLLARGSAAEVREALGDRLEQDGSVGADAWVVLALAEHRLRHEMASTEAIARAVQLAAPEEARLTFLRPRDSLAPLLRRHVDVVGTYGDFVTDLLAILGDNVPEALPDSLAADPLTDRELSVLAYLPSMRSNDEIAESLGISVNTVKQHLKSINRKLGVGSRREAVRVGRALGLVPLHSALSHRPLTHPGRHPSALRTGAG